MSAVLALGQRREMFVDNLLIDRLDGAQQRLQPPDLRGDVLVAQPPHENACTACYNLIDDRDGGLFLYYRGYYPIGAEAADHRQEQTCNVALSDDGVHFHRPNLDLFEGATDHKPGVAPNTVWQGVEAHNFCVLVDDNPNIDPTTRFKAVGGGSRDRLFGFTSADGLHWNRLHTNRIHLVPIYEDI